MCQLSLHGEAGHRRCLICTGTSFVSSVYTKGQSRSTQQLKRGDV
jgi:hypothetical protein